MRQLGSRFTSGSRSVAATYRVTPPESGKAYLSWPCSWLVRRTPANVAAPKCPAACTAGLLGAATLAGVLLTSQLQGQLKYALPLSGGVTLYVAATDLLPEVNREPNWRMAMLVFVGVATLLILKMLFHA